MAIEARIETEGNLFASARTKFEAIVERLKSAETEMLAATEDYIVTEGRELQRLLLQARLDVLTERERAALARNPPPRGLKARLLPRQVETTLGRVGERRHALKREGEASVFPLDAELNVPADMYSHPLRRRVAEEAVHGSFDHTVAQVESTTGGHVPKRQAQQLVVRASQDVEAFYAARPRPANDTLSDEALLVMSTDGCAIKMVPEGLREPTRRAADKAEQDAEVALRGDPTAKAQVKSHQTRRAVVTAVWEQEPHERTRDDVIANVMRLPQPESRKRARDPKPQNKRVAASVEQDQRQRTRDMFDEADRRDPKRQREAIALVDGDEHQTATILEEGQRRGRPLTLVLDLLHAMHYLWLAAMAATARERVEAEALVVHWTIMLLTGNPSHVVATIRGTATRRGLRGKAREDVDTAADYLLKRTPFIDYASFIARGLPIATGIIEGACRYLVRDRMDITGARWGVDVAEAVLKLRAVQASGDWVDYWNFHLTQEAIRNYAQAA